MKRIIIWLLLQFLTSQIHAQNYIEYQRAFNRIDEDVLSLNYSSAIERLDSIYANYNFIYSKHCIKALQICVSSNDTIRADRWLGKSFSQGIPIWIINSNEITRRALTYSTTQKTLRSFDSLYSIYKASIDTNLRKKIDSLLTVDQKFTRRINDGALLLKPVYWLQWRINNRKQLKSLKGIIENYGYPEEKLIGLSVLDDSATFSKHFTFWGPSELRDAKVQIMLQHCYSTSHKIDVDFKQRLYQNLQKGNIPVFQYAIIVDFMYPDKRKYISDNYFIDVQETDSNFIEKINENRNSVGLMTFETEKRNRLLQRERRKNGKANSEIMLE